MSMFLTALIMGFAGSLHCAGMCSPLAMAVTNRNRGVVLNRMVYNLGRIITYGILGAIVSTVGFVLPFNNFQNALSIALGVILLFMATTGVTGLRIPFFTAAVIRFTNRLKVTFGKFIQHKTPGAMLMLGALNGLLPCGLTFLALSLALTMKTPLNGFLYMLTFGVGTLPVMAGLISIIGFVTNKLHWNSKAATSGLMIISGLLLIARVFLVHLPENHQHSTLVEIVICR